MKTVWITFPRKRIASLSSAEGSLITNQLTIIIVASWLAGLAAFAGGVIARATDGADTVNKREITHGIVAFGGGILVAAVAFALLPRAMDAQNLPEGFNAFREMTTAGRSARLALTTLLAISALGPLAACAGYLFLQDQPTVTASIMAFACGMLGKQLIE